MSRLPTKDLAIRYRWMRDTMNMQKKAGCEMSHITLGMWAGISPTTARNWFRNISGEDVTYKVLQARYSASRYPGVFHEVPCDSLIELSVPGITEIGIVAPASQPASQIESGPGVICPPAGGPVQADPDQVASKGIKGMVRISDISLALLEKVMSPDALTILSHEASEYLYTTIMVMKAREAQQNQEMAELLTDIRKLNSKHNS